MVEQIDPVTGNHGPFVSGLKTAIDDVQLRDGDDSDYLVLQHTSGDGPPFLRPGLVLCFETTHGAPTTIADYLSRPISMALDDKTGMIYVTEYGGRLLAIPTS